MVKKLKWNLILMSLLYVGLGIFLVMKPGTALNIVCYALGGVVLACAAVQLIRYFVVERGVFQSQLTLISGLVCLALGVFLLLRSDIVVSILPIVFGLFVIFDSLGRIQNALELRRCEYSSWKVFLLLAVLSVVLGIVMVVDPFGTMETLVMAIGVPALRIICPHFLLAGAGIVLSSVFQALGNGVFSLTVSICRQLVVLIPAAWLLSRTGEVNMVWWAFIIAEVVSLALSLVFMARINRTVIVPLSEKQDAAV